MKPEPDDKVEDEDTNNEQINEIEEMRPITVSRCTNCKVSVWEIMHVHNLIVYVHVYYVWYMYLYYVYTSTVHVQEMYRDDTSTCTV